MTDSAYVRHLLQLGYDRTELDGAELASLLREEADRYEADPAAASDPTRLGDDSTPSRGRFEADSEHTTLDHFEEVHQ